MKESKGVYVTKRDIRENLLHREYQLYNNNIVNTIEVNKYKLTNDVGIQYNSKRDNIFYTHRNLLNGKRYHDHDLRYFNPIPKQIFTYSRSFTDIGVGSVKALQKKKVKKIYLPETDDRGVGSADLTNFIVRMQSLQNKSKSKQYRTIQSYYESKRTSSKCVGGAVDYRPECLVSAKVSPIIHTRSGSTSPKDPGFSSDNPKETKDSKDIEIGTVVIEKELVTTDTQFEEPEIETLQVTVETKSVISEPKEEVRRTPKQSVDAGITSVEIKTSVVPSETEPKLQVVLPEKKYDIPEPLKGSFSSDSFVQHVHNLEQPSEYSKQRDPMENKMEREYRKMFATVSRDDKTEGIIEKQIPQKSTSLFRRRFTAIRKSLGKKDSKNAMGQNQSSVPSVKDASVTSDPPSLEEKSFSSINGYPSKRIVQKNASYKKSYTGKKSSKTWSKANAVDSEYGQGVKGMFKLWGKKFNLDDTSDAREDMTQPPSFEDKPKEKEEEAKEKVPEPKHVSEALSEGEVEEEKILDKDKEKKEGKKFFFFKKRHSKDKTKNQNITYKNKKGVTTGRCEVKDGLSLRIGAARPPSSKSRPTTPTSFIRKQISTPTENDLVRAAWLMKYLSNPIESRNSVKIRWNNKTYTTSSSTVFELMGSVYKNTGVVLKSKSEITTEASSTWSYNRPNVNFVQQIEAWMVPKTIPDQKLPVIMRNRSAIHIAPEKTKSENENKQIEVTISDQKWILENTKAHAHKIEVVLHSKNFVKLQKPEKARCLKIDIPKGYFNDSSSDEPQPEHTSDEEVYNIVEYETLNSGPKLKQTQTISRVSNSGDHDSDSENVQVTVSLKSGLYEGSKIMETVIKRPPAHRSVAIQGSNVYIAHTCDIVGVGIITRREIREVGKPIVLDYLSDYESEHSLPKTFPNNSEFAKSYLQESYRHWQPQYLDMFSWCVSDSHMQCCTEHNSWNSHNNGDISKSCPNVYEEYVTQISSYSSGGCRNPQHPCYDDKKKNEKKSKKEKQDKKDAPYRVLPKDSLEVFRKRKIYAFEKSKWIKDSSVEPYSVPSNADTGVQGKCCQKDNVKKKEGPTDKNNAKSKKKTAKISPDAACTIPSSCCTKDSCKDPCEYYHDDEQCPPMCPPLPPPAEGDGPKTPAPILNYKSSRNKQPAKNCPDENPATSPKVCCKQNQEPVSPKCQQMLPNKSPPSPAKCPASPTPPKVGFKQHQEPILPKCQQMLPSKSPPSPAKCPASPTPPKVGFKQNLEPISPKCQQMLPNRSPPSPAKCPVSPTPPKVCCERNQEPISPKCQQMLPNKSPPSPAKNPPALPKLISPRSPDYRCPGKYNQEQCKNMLLLPPGDPSVPQPPGCLPVPQLPGDPSVPQCQKNLTSSKPSSCDDCCNKPSIPCYLRPPQQTKLKKDCSHYKSSPSGSVNLMQKQLSPERSCQTKQSMSPQRDSISPSSSRNSKTSRLSKIYRALDSDTCFSSPKKRSPVLQRRYSRSNETQTLSSCPPSDKSPVKSPGNSPNKCPNNNLHKFSKKCPPKSLDKSPDQSPTPSKFSQSHNTQTPSPRKCQMGFKFSNSGCIQFPKPQTHPLPKNPKTPPQPSSPEGQQKTSPCPPETGPIKTPPCVPKLSPPSPQKGRCPKGLKISNADCDNTGTNDADSDADDSEAQQADIDNTSANPNTAQCCREQPCCQKISPHSNSSKEMRFQINSKHNESPTQCPKVHHTLPDCHDQLMSAKVQPRKTKEAHVETPIPHKSSTTQESTVASEVQSNSCPEDQSISISKCKSAPLKCPNQDCTNQLDLQPKSQPNLEKGNVRKLLGIFLKKYPRKIDLSKTNVIRLNSKEKISFKLNDDNANIKENKGAYMKIKDEDNVTLVERKDYKKSPDDNKTSKQTLLNNIYNDTKVNRIATPITINNISSVERENKIEESKSNESVVNVIEINFNLRVIQGDKTTEINVGNTDSKTINDEHHKPNKRKADYLDDRAKEVYIVKDEDATEETNTKNDLNIRILIKNYKPKTESSTEKKAVDDFSQKISKKFNTVSTGYSVDIRGEHPDDTCFSVHRATIDLTTSDKSKETTSKEKMFVEGKKKGSDVKFKGCTVLSDEILSHTLEEKTSVTGNMASATEAESNMSLTSEIISLNLIALPKLSEHSKTESSRLCKHRSVQSISGMRYVFVDSKQPSSKNIYLSSKSLHRSSRSIPRKWNRSDEGDTEKTFNTSESVTFKESRKAVVIKDLFKSQARLSLTDTDDRGNSLGNKTSDEPTDFLGKTSDEHTDAVMKSSEDRTDRTDYGKLSEDQESDTKTSDFLLEKIPIEELDYIDLGKSKKEQKKEMLKQVFDSTNFFKRPKTKNRIQKLKDILKAFLASDTESDTDHDIFYNKISKNLPKCAWDPQAKHNSESLNNFFEGGGTAVSKTALDPNNFNDFQSDESAYSEDEEKPKNKRCLCSNFAEKLHLGNIQGGGCCCRKMPEQVCEQVSCNFMNEVSLEDYSYFAPSVECVPCQTNNSRYKSSIHCAKIMSISSKKTSLIAPQSGKTSLIEHLQGESDNLTVQPVSTKVSFKSRKSELKNDIKEISSSEGHFLRKADEKEEMEPISAKMSIRVSKIERQVQQKSSYESRHQEYRDHSSVKTDAITEEDKVVYHVMEDKPEKSPSRREADRNRKHHKKIKNEADVLQMYETKKAVLEIYAEKTVTDDEEHFVATLPRFERDTESQLYESYEHLERNNYKRVYKRNFVMMCIGR